MNNIIKGIHSETRRFSRNLRQQLYLLPNRKRHRYALITESTHSNFSSAQQNMTSPITGKKRNGNTGEG